MTAKLHAWLGDQDEFVFLDCARPSGEEHRSLLFTGPVQWIICTEPGQAGAFLAEADDLRSRGYYLAGWFAYEFGYQLEPSLMPLFSGIDSPYAVLGVFADPIVIDHRSGDWSGLEKVIATAKTRAEESFVIDSLRTSIDKVEYLRAVDWIKEYIVAGDTYQVNYTMKLQFGFKGALSSLYGSLRRNQAVSYGAWIRRGGRDIMSFSPELFFRSDINHITVRPMKGTMKRGRTLDEDVRQRRSLRDDLKNRSENVMIVDLLRNDLGRLLHVTGGGRVQPRSLFDVEVYDTLLQLTSTIDGIPTGGPMPGLRDIIPALFPCGSVTGAPKIRTMEIIHELEKEPRGIYCGAIGYSGPRGSVFNVPIRTVVMEGSRGEMGIGSGIVFDSDPEAEWQESLLKAGFLTRPQADFQLIETLLWRPESGYWLLSEHLERLADSATYFLFAFDRERVVGRLHGQESLFSGPTRVRLLLHRDGSVRITAAELDYDVRPSLKPAAVAGPLPKVVISATPTDPDNVHLYHKTTQRTLYDDERQSALEKRYHEVLFINRKGEVAEGSISNIFIAGEDRLLTPPVRCGLLPGTFRRHLLDLGMAAECILTREDLRRAGAVYIGNSVRGLVQVEVEDD
ncbi:MAG: chorismate-binding protein [Desulfobulbaceae bacterium]|nr:chorismate-binding protein [Desulfobulbaceae bacterium]